MYSKDIKYPKEFYNEILDKIISTLNIDKKIIAPRVFIIWRSEIKCLFLDGFLIKEIVEVLPDAIKKKIFPVRWGLFKKVRNLIELNRNSKIRGVYSPLPSPPRLRDSGGFQSVKSIFQSHKI